MDILVLTFAADQFRPTDDPADAAADIWIGDQGPYPIKIQATRGAAQAVLFSGTFPNPLPVKIAFTNDAYAGPSADRNLYYLGATLNGIYSAPPDANAMYSTGDSVGFSIASSTPVPTPTPTPTALTIVANVRGVPDAAGGGFPHLAATVDGSPIGPQFLTTANVAAYTFGAANFFTGVPHRIGIGFYDLNGTRRVEIQSVSVNGSTVLSGAINLGGLTMFALAADGTLSTVATPTPTPAPTPTPTPTPPLLIDATFSAATDRANLFTTIGAYPWLIYGQSWTNPERQVANGITAYGPIGDGTDGLYGQARHRHAHFVGGTPSDVHVLTEDHLSLRAWCGLTSGDPKDCSDGQIVSGTLRFAQAITKGTHIEICARLPAGAYAWPTMWLNTSQQDKWKPDGSPGDVHSQVWTAEFDILDGWGWTGTPAGHYIIAGDPTPLAPATYARPGDAGPVDLPPTFVDIPGLTHWTGDAEGWYAHVIPDLTQDFHVYGLLWDTDDTWSLFLDGQLYRKRGYVWPPTPPAHLIVGLQVGAKFNDLSGITPQGGVVDGWNFDIRYIRAWAKP